MADNHSLNDVRELKLGASFTNNKASQYHTIKYDFKPASVDVNKMATVDVGTNHQVTVTVPHLDGAGVPQTVFKGNQRPYTKECVLIIDRVTGEITLEKLSSNIQVKKTRQESAQKPRPLTPVTADFTNTTQRSTSRTRVATNRRTANPNTVAAAAQAHSQAARFNGTAGGGPKTSMMRSPPRVKTSPPQAAPWSGGGNSTLASLPMIGLDEALGAPAPAHAHNGHAARPERQYPAERERPQAQALHTQAMHNQALHNQALHSQALHSQALHSQALHSQALHSQALHSQAPQSHEQLTHAHHSVHSNVPPPQPQPPAPPQDDSSSSSSSDSDSGSGSDSDSDDNDPAPALQQQHSLTNGTGGNPLPSDVLNDDLCLSESGSDSD